MGAVERIGQPVSPAAVSRLLSRYGRPELESFVAVAIDLLDLLDPDPDLEEGGDDEPIEANGDTRDAAYIEWQTMRGSQKGGPNILAGLEDDEEDDPAGQADEDGINTALHLQWAPGAGCLISDDDTEHDGREPDYDAEVESMGGDVPMLPVVDGEGRPLGISNLQSSFVGQGVRSADTGALHTGKAVDVRRGPGMPV